ncbi:uncharacterized protein FOMMEDRAFT_154749 [Fomitiporia mediterranea MF3/22]|uniref:uncharacterized protein n=1 Tax=Fomitiporia mediterranea (strain MF3/22) TaxID=694068 RepID=UPI00044081C7|nr:uncharacterized protein FOMMEDRAFT_154749 [Fomitiporia mediterranea MF3/22]EJD03649.1 hypothetical protein FOMMEDRAFT_154749 [Fomitiporia mediterranea MF3/22]
MAQRATATPPARPQPSQLAIEFQQCQRRCANRPVDHFPWKDFHLRMSGHGYVVGTDWAMTTFDTRTEDQFFDHRRLQTIDENTEVLFFHPFDPLNYSTDSLDYNTVEDCKDQADKPVQESVLKKIYAGTMSTLSQIELKARGFYYHLFGRP